MSFQFDRWLAALIASTQAEIDAAELAAISGLIEADYAESDCLLLMADLLEELDDIERKHADKKPREPHD